MALPDAPAAGASMVEPLSPMAPPDAPAAGASMVEPLVPNGSSRRASGGGCGFLGRFSQRPLGLQAPID